MTERKMFSTRIPVALKKMIDAHPDDNQDIATSAFWREFGGQDKGSVKREIEEKEEEIALWERQIKEREERIAETEQQLKALRAKLGEIEDEESEEELHREQLLDSLQSSEARENNANVVRVARELDKDPSEVVDIMVERFDKERKDTGSDF